eukprot:COSAG06_NODE_14525_length_1149_cov_4.620952_1_plen_302_part_00
MQDSGQDSGQDREMSDKTNVDALTSAFGNSMSLDGGEQGGEPSPDTSDNLLNELNNLAVPQDVAASAAQRAAALAGPQQAGRLTARQLDVYMNNANNNTTNKRGLPSDGSSDGSDDSDDSDFEDPHHLADAKEIIEVCWEQGPTFQQLINNAEFMNAFCVVHHRRFIRKDYDDKTTSPLSINSKPRKAKKKTRDSQAVTAEKEEKLQKQEQNVNKMEVDLPKRGIPVDLLLFLHNSALGKNNLGGHFKDIVAYCKELQKMVNMQKELEDRKVSAALNATAKRLKEEREALKQRKKERTRKV